MVVIRIGYSIFKSWIALATFAARSLAGDRSQAMPITWIFLPPSVFWISLRCGIDFLHGAHQVPQKSRRIRSESTS